MSRWSYDNVEVTFAPGIKNQPRANASDFKKVAIVETKAKRVTIEATVGALCLELPCGSRVTGLTLAQVAELMRRQP